MQVACQIPAQDGSGGVVGRLLLGYGQINSQGYIQAGRRAVLIPEPGSLDSCRSGRYELALVLLGHPGASGSGHEDKPASGDGQHGPNGAIELVGDSGRFVQDQEGDCTDAPDGLLGAREGQDPGTVSEAYRELGVAVELHAPVHHGQELGELEHELLGLPERGRVQDYGAAGAVDGLPEGQDGSDGGLAGLPGAVEDYPLGPGAKELGLPGIGHELEVI